MSQLRAGGPANDLRRTTWRLAVQTAGLLVLVLLLVGAVVLVTVLQAQERQVSDALEKAVAHPEVDDDRDDGPTSAGVFLAVLHEGRLMTSGRPPAGLPDTGVMERVRATGTTDRRSLGTPPDHYQVLTVVRGDRVIQAAYPLVEQDREQQRILWALAIAGGVGVVLATLLAAWLSRRTVRPLSEALALQRRFVADASHELRTPLTLLSTRVQLLRRRVRRLAGTGSDPSAYGSILRDTDGVVADTEALTDILSELLMAADTRTPVPRHPIDLTGVVGDAVAAAQASAESRGLRLVLDSSGTAVVGSGSATALRRAVTALVDNALSHAAHRVDVRVTEEPRQVVVTVADDGPGISGAVLPRLFERFAHGREGPTPAAAERHYGLGLSLVSEIAERHGGTVSAHNRAAPEHGAVLTMRLAR